MARLKTLTIFNGSENWFFIFSIKKNYEESISEIYSYTESIIRIIENILWYGMDNNLVILKSFPLRLHQLFQQLHRSQWTAENNGRNEEINGTSCCVLDFQKRKPNTKNISSRIDLFLNNWTVLLSDIINTFDAQNKNREKRRKNPKFIHIQIEKWTNAKAINQNHRKIVGIHVVDWSIYRPLFSFKHIFLLSFFSQMKNQFLVLFFDSFST